MVYIIYFWLISFSEIRSVKWRNNANFMAILLNMFQKSSIFWRKEIFVFDSHTDWQANMEGCVWLSLPPQERPFRKRWVCYGPYPLMMVGDRMWAAGTDGGCVCGLVLGSKLWWLYCPYPSLRWCLSPSLGCVDGGHPSLAWWCPNVRASSHRLVDSLIRMA